MRHSLGTFVLACLLALSPFAAPAAHGAQALGCGATACTPFQLVHAGASYGWYPAHWRYEFEDRSTSAVPNAWHHSGASDLYQTNGMLTLIAKKGAQRRPATTTLTKYAATEGRWEVRMRTDQLTSGNASYAVQIKLVPAKRSARGCGDRDVDLLDFSPRHERTARTAVHTPGTTYTFKDSLSRDVGNDEWHEFAVEVTDKRISWFVDGQVAATEPRAGAGAVPLAMQARLVPLRGASMNATRLQLDWARYWTLANSNGRSLAAPAMRTHAGTAC